MSLIHLLDLPDHAWSAAFQHPELGLLSAAILWAVWGLSVYPTRPGLGPTPYLAKPVDGPGGHHQATNDLDQLVEWWETWPNAQAHAAIPDDVVVLDLDDHDGTGAVWDAIDLAERDIGPLPNTMTVATPRNGMHLWFRTRTTGGEQWHPSLPRTRTLPATPSIELKRHNAPLPGTEKPEGSYRLLRSVDSVNDLAVLPISWRQVFRKPKLTPFVLKHSGNADLLDQLCEETANETTMRNVGLFRRACVAAQRNLPDWKQRLSESAQASGLEPAEVRATIESAERKATLDRTPL